MPIDNTGFPRPIIKDPILSKDQVIIEALDTIIGNQKEMQEELQYIRSQLDSHILWMNFKDDPKLKRIFEDFQKDKLLILGDKDS